MAKKKVLITGTPQYKDGGKTNPPRYGTKQEARAYQDSLDAYNTGEKYARLNRMYGQNGEYYKIPHKPSGRKHVEGMAFGEENLPENYYSANGLPIADISKYYNNPDNFYRRVYDNNTTGEIWNVPAGMKEVKKWSHAFDNYKVQPNKIKVVPDKEAYIFLPEYKKPVQPIITGEQINKLPILNQQLPIGTSYTPQYIQNPYESTNWYSPEVQGGNYIPAGFRTTVNIPQYKDGGKMDKRKLPKYPQEVPTTNYIPELAPFRTTANFLDAGKPWEGKPMYMNPMMNREQEVVRSADPKRNIISKAGQVARHPLTAASYIVQGQEVPDYLEYADRNKFDNAVDIINPMTYYDAAKRTLTAEHFRDPNKSVGEALGLTALDAAMVTGAGKGIYNKYSPKQYVRVPASGVLEGERLGMVTQEGELNTFNKDPKNVTNSEELKKMLKESADNYKRAYAEWEAKPNHFREYFRPLEDFQGYSLEEIAKKYSNNPLLYITTLAGQINNSNIRQPSPSEVQSVVPIQWQNNNNKNILTPQDTPQFNRKVKTPTKKQIEAVENPSPDARIEWYHSHNGEVPVMDSTKTLKRYKDGGNIMKKKVKITGTPQYQTGGNIRGTKLSSAQEQKYQIWKNTLPKNLQYEGDYDLRGFYKENPTWTPNSPGQHMTDKYKLPNHPTFSNESMYYNTSNRDSAGYWDNNMYIPYNPAVKDTVREYQKGGKVSTTDSVRHIAGKTMDYEYTKGSAYGTGLSNYGNPELGSYPTKAQAIDWYMENIAPKVSYFPSAVEQGEAGDFLYNTGRDPRIYLLDQYIKSVGDHSGLPNRGSYNVDTKTSSWTPELKYSLDEQWRKYSPEINKLPTNDRRVLLNKGRDFYYQNINKINGQPNPAYYNTWKDRIRNTNEYKKGGKIDSVGAEPDPNLLRKPIGCIPYWYKDFAQHPYVGANISENARDVYMGQQNPYYTPLSDRFDYRTLSPVVPGQYSREYLMKFNKPQFEDIITEQEYKDGGNIMKKKVKVTGTPEMADGGSAPGSFESTPTEWGYAQPMANMNNPMYQDYGNSYKVDNWSGLYSKPFNSVSNNSVYQFYGAAPVDTPMTQGYYATSRPLNMDIDAYSIDRLRAQDMAYGGYAGQTPPDSRGRRSLSTPWMGSVGMTKGMPDEYSVKDVIPNIGITGDYVEGSYHDISMDKIEELRKRGYAIRIL